MLNQKPYRSRSLYMGLYLQFTSPLICESNSLLPGLLDIVIVKDNEELEEIIEMFDRDSKYLLPRVMGGLRM